ncbi:hypothetical protein AABB02_39745 [Streptomyces rimosus]|uniref:hypothetical protein n=1 Tax=Streptomyces rimosus TaxID=1927 RepID=UPI0031D46249
MSDILLTLLVATSTAVVTALATGLLITPRMEARKKRLGDVHAARDAFKTHMSRIASVCALLRQVPPPADDEPGWTPVMRQRLAGERERWWQQLDESTRWLIDNVAAYAESWGPHMLVGLAVQYASNARMVVLSERQEARKAELLIALTLPVQRQFFGWPWPRARHAIVDRQSFTQTIARINTDPTAP